MSKKGVPVCLYDVLYIDKFIDPNRSRDVINKVSLLARLPVQKQLHLISGRPMLVLSAVDVEVADECRRMIMAEGGACWIQKQSTQGEYLERRCNMRRYILARRIARRSEAFQTDRRKSRGRRVNVRL